MKTKHLLMEVLVDYYGGDLVSWSRAIARAGRYHWTCEDEMGGLSFVASSESGADAALRLMLLGYSLDMNDVEEAYQGIKRLLANPRFVQEMSTGAQGSCV